MDGKVVIITGASSGIGKALARELADRNAKLSLAARNLGHLEEIRAAFPQVDILTIQTDVSREEDCKNLINKTVEKFGKIDLLINNAGISMRALFENTEIAVLKSIMDVNFWGAVYCTKYALPYLLKSGGSLAGVSSIAGYKGLPGRSGYSASKFALQGFLEVIRIENRKKGLHVLIACPGFTASNIRTNALAGDGKHQGETPRDEEKMMTPEQVAKKIVWAVLHKKHRLVLTAQGKITVFINKVFPRWMDKMVYNHMAKEPNSPFK